jgi:hypothetical protein
MAAAVVRVSIGGELLQRYETYSQITGKTVPQAAREALEDWMDTVGEGDIEVITGVPIPMTTPVKLPSMPMESIFDLPELKLIRPIGNC